MKKLMLFLALFIFLGINANAQNVTLTVCEYYGTYGPVGVGTSFTTGYLTVVAKSNLSMYYDKVFIQFDKLGNDGIYNFYKKFSFTFPDGYKTVYFSKSGNYDMSFDHPGYYNVFLLDSYGNTISYTTVRITGR